MKYTCKKNKKCDLNKIQHIEKWILDNCNCNRCRQNSIKNIMSDIKIKKEQNIQLNELTLTSKMIIKIQIEIAKKFILNSLNK